MKKSALFSITISWERCILIKREERSRLWQAIELKLRLIAFVVGFDSTSILLLRKLYLLLTDIWNSSIIVLGASLLKILRANTWRCYKRLEWKWLASDVFFSVHITGFVVISTYHPGSPTLKLLKYWAWSYVTVSPDCRTAIEIKFYK